MIPILYAGNETQFLNNGLGRLADAISCKVTEERNGTFELVLTYPITGIHYDDIAENCIIYAKTEDGGNNQAFIIYKISKPLNGIVTINAQHISYLLNGYIVLPFTAVSLADAMGKINTNAVLTTGFTFTTDINSTTAFELDAPRSIRSLLGGESGSLLDVYGGYDYKFDNFSVSLLANRGNDNGVVLKYGKNLTDLKAVDNTTNIYTGIVPYWTNNDTTVYVNGYVVYSQYANIYPYKYIKLVDFSSDFETAPTQAQLQAKAESYLSNNDGWKIKSSIDVSFISLAQSEEYKDIAPLERVKLCDNVTVQYTKLGVSFKTKVIKTVYDVILEKYDSISLGDTTYTLAKAIAEVNQTNTVQQTNSAIQSAVNRATALIRGGLGGHVVMRADGDGLPQEILIMDTDDITTAQKVWRWNLNGFGYSSTGVDGTYGTAITMNGEIVANYITTGTLNGNLIQADSIQASALSLSAKEELESKHSYISSTLFSDISQWEYGTVAPYYETVNGTTYIVFDGTGITAFNTSYYARVKTNANGNINFDYYFAYYVDRSVTVSQQRFPYVNYTVLSTGTGSITWKWLQAQTIPANIEYTWNNSFKISDVDATKDIYFGFYYIPNCKIYLKTFTLTSTVDSYAESGMEFNAEGITTTVKKDGVISSINQSSEQITISASKLDLTGDLSLKGDFTSYDLNDNTTYAFLDSGSISFYNTGANVFTVASTPLLGNNAGIFFGDSDDPAAMASHTYIHQDAVTTPQVYCHVDDRYSTYVWPLVVEGDARITDITANTLTLVGASNSWTSIAGNVMFSNGTYGTGVYFYNTVYNSNGGSVFVSDKRKKRSIKDLVIEKAKSFIMALKPCEFKFIKDISTSDRKHHGFIAQDVKTAMPEDWGIYVEDQERDFIGLRYDEMIADMVAVIQDQEKRIEALERAVYDKSND